MSFPRCVRYELGQSNLTCNVDYTPGFAGNMADRVYDYDLAADGKGLGRLLTVTRRGGPG